MQEDAVKLKNAYLDHIISETEILEQELAKNNEYTRLIDEDFANVTVALARDFERSVKKTLEIISDFNNETKNLKSQAYVAMAENKAVFEKYQSIQEEILKKQEKSYDKLSKASNKTIVSIMQSTLQLLKQSSQDAQDTQGRVRIHSAKIEHHEDKLKVVDIDIDKVNQDVENAENGIYDTMSDLNQETIAKMKKQKAKLTGELYELQLEMREHFDEYGNQFIELHNDDLALKQQIMQVEEELKQTEARLDKQIKQTEAKLSRKISEEIKTVNAKIDSLAKDVKVITEKQAKTETWQAKADERFDKIENTLAVILQRLPQQPQQFQPMDSVDSGVQSSRIATARQQWQARVNAEPQRARLLPRRKPTPIDAFDNKFVYQSQDVESSRLTLPKVSSLPQEDNSQKKNEFRNGFRR